MTGICRAANEPAFPKELREEFNKLFAEFYPKATNSVAKAEISFEYDTTVFFIPSDGSKESPRSERGPRKDGVRAEIRFRPGEVKAQLLTPFTFSTKNYEHFVHHRFAPRTDTHLLVQLLYPESADKRFVERFKKLVKEFEHYVNQPQKQ